MGIWEQQLGLVPAFLRARVTKNLLETLEVAMWLSRSLGEDIFEELGNVPKAIII